jgi:hypothetical protein
MKNISLAIPTYNSSRYLEEIFRGLFKDFKLQPFNEIVINDDKSEEAEFKKIVSLVSLYSEKYRKINFEITQNSKNLGGFRNKYLTVKNCKNNLIYQIDSDNLIRKSTIKLLENTTFDSKVLYIPSNIYLLNDKKYLTKKINLTTNYGQYPLDDIKNFLLNNTDISKNNLNWALGIGNPIFHKEDYLSICEEGYESYLNIYSHDSYALVYFWLKANGVLYFDKNHSHTHRIHENSYWQTKGSIMVDSVYALRKLILAI